MNTIEKLQKLGYKSKFLTIIQNPESSDSMFSPEEVLFFEELVSKTIKVETLYANCSVKKDVVVESVSMYPSVCALIVKGTVVPSIYKKTLSDFCETGVMQIDKTTWNYDGRIMTFAG